MKQKQKKKLKVDPTKLEEALSQGKSQSQISRELGVTPAAVSLARSRLRKDATRSIIHLQRGGEIVKRNMVVMEQLTKANEELNSLLDLLSRWSRGDAQALEELKTVKGFRAVDPRALLIKCAREIQNGTLAYLEILKTVFSFSEVEEFMNTILEVLGECDAELQSKVIAKFQERRLGRGILKSVNPQTETEGEGSSVR